MIKIENVHKSFGQNHVLRGVNFEIRDSETVTIIGGSGCGKTVLLRHIVGLVRPDMGNVCVDGTDITCLTDKELEEIQKKFGYLFQSGALFDSLSAGENVAFGLRYSGLSQGKIDDRVEECLSMVGLGGIQSMKPADLSGGMRKRVALARAIARGPEYVLYDEPTTGLDPIFADAINDLIIHLKKTLKVTSVVVTHDMKSAFKVSDRIAMLYDGNLIAQGTSDEIKNSTNPYVQQFISGLSKGPIKLKLREYD
jgi:phospholipid/cholesterol/gamma-HCH transport system ATP-binding protein